MDKKTEKVIDVAALIYNRSMEQDPNQKFSCELHMTSAVKKAYDLVNMVLVNEEC